MAIERGDHDERQARIDALIEELRATEQRRLVERRIAQSNRAEAAQRAMRCITLPPPEKIH
jgi:hypothetical protein